MAVQKYLCYTYTHDYNGQQIALI